MNILDKTDRSQTPVFGQADVQVSKKDKCLWNEPGAFGAFRSIAKQDLNIDGRYQRGQVSEVKVRKIARLWDWKLFGVISVIARIDGTFWVYDGGHRVRAAFLRDDIVSVPCMVFPGETLEEEAEAFLGANLLKSNVSAYSQHRAQVVVGEPIAIAAKKILDKHSYTSTATARSNGFAAISTLKAIIKEDEVTAARVFAACVDIAGGFKDPISGEVVDGLFRCQRKLGNRVDILAGAYLEKLKKETLPGIEAVIRREKHLAGKGGAYVAARGILALLNKGRQKNLRWD